jgi:hypothetical protein
LGEHAACIFKVEGQAKLFYPEDGRAAHSPETLHYMVCQKTVFIQNQHMNTSNANAA